MRNMSKSSKRPHFLSKPDEPRTLDEFYRALGVWPSIPGADRVAGYGFLFGIGLLSITIAAGLVTLALPFTKPLMKIIAEISFLLGYLVLCCSGLLSVCSTVLGSLQQVSKRLETAHLTSTELSKTVAEIYSEECIRGRLHSIRRELQITARAPAKLPIMTGLITGCATVVRLLFLLQETVPQKSPETYIAALFTASSADILKAGATHLPLLGGIILFSSLLALFARGFIHSAHDRLLRMEAVFEKAEALVSRRRPTAAGKVRRIAFPRRRLSA